MSTNTNQPKPTEQVIACNFGAIDPANRSDHADTAENIFTSTLGIKELPQGYAFRLPLENAMLSKISEWIANERLCCPFFTFSMVVADELWLQLTGTDEVKGYIKSMLVDPLAETGKLPDKATWIEALTPKVDAIEN
jgi:hypothetical protein